MRELGEHLDGTVKLLEALVAASLLNGLVRLAGLLRASATAAGALSLALRFAGGWAGLIAAAAGALAVYFLPRLWEADEAAQQLQQSIQNAFRIPDFSGKTTEELREELAQTERAQRNLRIGLEQNAQNDANRQALAMTTRKVRALRAELELREKLAELNRPEAGGGEAGRTEDATEAAQDFVGALQQERDQLVLTKRALFEKQLAALELTDAEEALARQLYREIELEEKHQKALRESARAQEEKARAAEREAKERKRQADDAARDRHRAALAEWQEEMGAIKEAAQDMATEVEDALMSMEDNFDSMVQTVANVVEAMLREMARLAIRKAITEPLLQAFSGFLTAQFGPGPAPTPPGAAFGGSVAAGQAVMVGELGRELFVPRVPGHVLPMSGPGAVGGSTTIIVQQEVVMAPSMIDAASGARFLREHEGQILDTVARGARQSVAMGRALSGRN